MKPEIKTLGEKKLVGLHLKMSMANNKTSNLWQRFMPRRHEIRNAVGTNLYSLQEYNPGYFENFNPATEFEKWAAMEVTTYDEMPPEFEAFTLTGGLYAVFIHIGGPATGAGTFQHIFNSWLPNSGYTLDNRPHFEILGPKYKNDDPDSEEEIWIPIKARE